MQSLLPTCQPIVSGVNRLCLPWQRDTVKPCGLCPHCRTRSRLGQLLSLLKIFCICGRCTADASEMISVECNQFEFSRSACLSAHELATLPKWLQWKKFISITHLHHPCGTQNYPTEQCRALGRLIFADKLIDCFGDKSNWILIFVGPASRLDFPERSLWGRPRRRILGGQVK